LTRSNQGAHAGTSVVRNENLILKIEQRGDSFWAHWFWGPSEAGAGAQLEVLSKNRFRYPNVGEIEFGTDGNPRMTGNGMRPAAYVRVPDYQPTTAQLGEFDGRYLSKELDVPYYVTLGGGSLVIHPPKMAPRILLPLANDLFISDGISVRFTRDPGGQVSGFLMSGRWNRVQNLRFERAAARSGPSAKR
jgi:hypothetical protein